MKKGTVVWCQACQTGLSVNGPLPTICPECKTDDPRWTTRKPFKTSENDRRFLRGIKIDPEQA